MIKEEVTTAAVGTNLPNGKDVQDNSKPKKKPKTAFSKIVRNPAVKKKNPEYFPQPKSNRFKPNKSLGGGPLAGGGLGESNLIEHIVYIKGHKNSKGDNAPWVIKKESNGKILSSHASRKQAKDHLKQIEMYSHHGYGHHRSMNLEESLQRVKFVYNGKGATIHEPEVMVLDPNYDGREHWKGFGKKDYVLGYSLSHVSNRNEAIRNINDITDFTTLLGSEDDKEFYERIKQLFPEQATFIRAYKKGHIVSPKILDDNDNEVPVKLVDLKSARNNGFGF